MCGKIMADENLIQKIEDLEKDMFYLKHQNNNLTESIDYIKKLLVKNMDKTNFCPFCGEISSFDSFGIVPREKVKCPNCGSLERHRLVYLIFKRKFSYLFEKNIKLLHFAPEYIFYKLFEKQKNIDYYPVDFCPENFNYVNIRYKVDIQDINFDDCTFDLIYVSHVLEHIPDDIKAMKELYRVLKVGGSCIVMVPLFNMHKTFENDEYDTPELRLKYFGQEDHLRKYGQDIEDRLISVGFDVQKITAEDIISNDELENDVYRLCGEVAFICRK